MSKTDDLKNNDPNVKIYRFASPFVLGDEIADALLTVKESLDKNSKKIYSLELTEIKKPKGQAEAENTDYSPNGINKLQQKHEKVKQFIEKNQEKIPRCAHGKCHESIAIQCIAHAYCTYLIFCFAVLTDAIKVILISLQRCSSRSYSALGIMFVLFNSKSQ